MKALDNRIQSTQGSKLNIEQLVIQCKSSDSTAQETLYNQYADKMFHICLRYLVDQTEAEDAMTEGFVKVFSKIDSFEYRGIGSLNGWIKRIMINESLMILRKRKYDKISVDTLIKVSSGANTDAELEYAEILDLIYDLPKGYRTVFNMYVIEGYSHREIGEKLVISENTSKSQLSKARASLIKSLNKSGII